MSKSKSFLDEIKYKSISQKTNFQKNFYIKCQTVKCFLPEKGHYKLVKIAVNTGKWCDFWDDWYNACLMLRCFRGSRDRT